MRKFTSELDELQPPVRKFTSELSEPLEKTDFTSEQQKRIDAFIQQMAEEQALAKKEKHEMMNAKLLKENTDQKTGELKYGSASMVTHEQNERLHQATGYASFDIVEDSPEVPYVPSSEKLPLPDDINDKALVHGY